MVSSRFASSPPRRLRQPLVPPQPAPVLPLLLLLLLHQTHCDVEIYRDGGLISTVIEDSCEGLNSLLYPHCICVDNPQFLALDVNGSGYVDVAELSANLPAVSDHAAIFATLDADLDGRISLLEYLSLIHI